VAAQHRYAVECQSSYERGDLSAGLGDGSSPAWATDGASAWCRLWRRAQAPWPKGGVRWTLIVVRAEVRPFPPLSLLV